MKVLLIIPAILVFIFIFIIRRETFQLPDPMGEICPDGYMLRCVSDTLAGIVSVPFPGKSPCEEAHVSICLPKITKAPKKY
jgi:hypothetical protein